MREGNRGENNTFFLEKTYEGKKKGEKMLAGAATRNVKRGENP